MSDLVLAPLIAKPTASFEFTKRKRWRDLLSAELADAFVLIISAARRVLYCSSAISEILGWDSEELIDRDLLEFIPSAEKTSFQSKFEGYMRSNARFLSFVYLSKPVNSEYPRAVLLELSGQRLPFPAKDEEGLCFLVAKTYPGRNVEALNNVLALKIDQERLRQRLMKLKSRSESWSPGYVIGTPGCKLQPRVLTTEWASCQCQFALWTTVNTFWDLLARSQRTIMGRKGLEERSQEDPWRWSNSCALPADVQTRLNGERARMDQRRCAMLVASVGRSKCEESRKRANERVFLLDIFLYGPRLFTTMSILRPFRATDLFKFNNINLDIWTETFGIAFYLNYLSRWPDLCCVQEAPNGRLMGYIIGKAEGSNTEWHGHVTALTVAPEYRRLSLARKMTCLLELVSDQGYRGFFVDLYVRCANTIAIEMYEGMGYSVYRRVREYYGNLGGGKGGQDEEDAFDMRKPLSRDPQRRSVRTNGRDMVVPIASHAFNADRSEVAVSLNSNDVEIFAYQNNEWKSKETLSEHDKAITSIDWAPNSNRIVTASQDRNAYVWQQTEDAQTGKLVWKPTLVLLRINRAATHVRWSPMEDKFAVSSGARAVSICFFDAESDWWTSKLLKKPIRSTVLCVDWHPNNVLLAAGGADMKARVFSAYIKEVDTRPAPTVWGDKLPFNTICGEYSSPAGGWVHSVGFSPSGDVLAFTSHDSSINVVYPATGAVHNIRMSTLPLLTLTWTSEDSIVAAGHDCQPLVFSGSPDGWKQVGSLDDTSAPKSASSPRSSFGGSPTVGRLDSAAFRTFRNADTRGVSGLTASATSTNTELMTVHQNTINSVRPYETVGGRVTRVSTSGVDGRLVIWDVKSVAGSGLTARMGGMHLR